MSVIFKSKTITHAWMDEWGNVFLEDERASSTHRRIVEREAIRSGCSWHQWEEEPGAFYWTSPPGKTNEESSY